MLPLFLIITALRKFIIVAINFIFVIKRASNFLVIIMVLLNNDVRVLYLSFLELILEGVLLCFICFLFLLSIKSHLHFVGASRWVDTIRVIESTLGTFMSLRNFSTVYVRLLPCLIPSCITVRCLHVERWYHFLKCVCLQWVDSRFPVDCLIPTMSSIIRWVHLCIQQSVLYLASAAWAFAISECLSLRLRCGCFHIISLFYKNATLFLKSVI